MRIKLNKFKELYTTALLEEYKQVDAEYLYEQYRDKIYLYLGLITRNQVQDKPLTQEELRMAFGVSKTVWEMSKKYFPEFKEVLGGKRNLMKFKSEKDLQRGIDESPSNPKLLEMQFRMYNDEWKEKGNKIDINLPSVIDINISKGEMTEEELDAFNPELVEKDK